MSKDQVVVEVMRQRVGDPIIDVFHITITDSRGTSEETLGSRELMQKYLEGLKAGLRVGGWYGQIAWHLPETFHEPSGLRWTLYRGKIAEIEELYSDGETVAV